MTAEREKKPNTSNAQAEKQSGIEISKQHYPAAPGGKDVMERSDGSLAARKENQPAIKPDAAVAKS